MYEIVYGDGTSAHDEKRYTVKARSEMLASRITNLQRQNKRIIEVRAVASCAARAALAVFEKAHAPTVIERHDLVMPIYEDTPTDDEREALLAVLDDRLGICYCQSYTGERHDHNPPCSRVKLADEILALRRSEVPEPQGEPSDAQVEAAWGVIERDGLTVLERSHVRAALRAAGGVR